MTASDWLKSVHNTAHYAPPNSLHNDSVGALHKGFSGFDLISVSGISDPVGDRVYGLFFHANETVVMQSSVAAGFAPPSTKISFFDMRIAEPLEGGRHLVWSAMDAGIFGMVEHQHRNLDRRYGPALGTAPGFL